jgi:hypothetical protein
VSSPAADRPAADVIVWRIPSAVTLALLVIAATLLAVALYLHPAPLIRIVAAVVGVAFAVGGWFAARQLCYADAEEVIIRRLRSARSYRWEEIVGVYVVQTGKTGMTVAVELASGSQILVPPSLVLPATPHGLSSTQALLSDKARQLRAVGGLRSE